MIIIIKKKFSTLTAAVLVAAMAFAFTGCGTKDAEPAEAPAASEEAVAEAQTPAAEETTEAAETETVSEEATEAAAGASTVEDWVNSEEIQAALQVLSDSQEGMKVNIYAADDKTVAFSFTYDEQVEIANDEEMAMLTDIFEQAMTQQEAVFVQMRDQLVSETGMDDVVLRIEYLNADGTVLYDVDYAN